MRYFIFSILIRYFLCQYAQKKFWSKHIKNASAKTSFFPVRLKIAKQVNYLNWLQSKLLKEKENFYFLQLRHIKNV